MEPLTLDKIVEHQERLRREIVERECLLAAFNVLHGYAANGQSPKSMEFSSLASALLPPALIAPLTDSTPAPAAPPKFVPPQQYINPELAALERGHGGDGRVVQWAINQMTEDYSLRDLVKRLRPEGCFIESEKISVVLTRMRSRGEIEEVHRGRGRRPTIYRKPEIATPPPTESTDPINAAESTTGSALAS